MIDIKDLRENPEKYRKGAELKGIDVEVSRIIDLDEQRVRAQQEFESLRSEQNKQSKEIAKIKDPAAKKEAIAKMGELAGNVKAAEERLKTADAAMQPLLLQIPQPPDEDVPVGKDASQNVVLYRWGEPRRFEFKPKTHIELGESLDLMDFKAGAALAGARSYFLKGMGAELHQAVLRLAFDMMTKEKGFTALSVPVLVREVAMQGTGFFPAGREQTYYVQADELYLTGTAEVGLTAYHMNETLDEADLPKKYVAVSTCFRREAGTYGKDTAGLYRVHQFDKCEQVVICRNDVEESKKWHREMLGYSEELLQRLKLPYRVIQCCSGDIGVKNASMMDIETWMPSRQHKNDPDSGYGETHSASRLYEFQARRLNLRYKGADAKIRYCHTLNNTVVAAPRILIPILENYQNADGSVTIPEALRPYLGNQEKIAAK
ncbi:MAG TPA: serine--tRNA ligase [Tepidisphaeraceae bacterium]|jgi:seryl-tRNA synthetase|nr:serine--tRNA ligase [Tepidisphaeraceae bacterium]